MSSIACNLRYTTMCCYPVSSSYLTQINGMVVESIVWRSKVGRGHGCSSVSYTLDHLEGSVVVEVNNGGELPMPQRVECHVQLSEGGDAKQVHNMSSFPELFRLGQTLNLCEKRGKRDEGKRARDEGE